MAVVNLNSDADILALINAGIVPGNRYLFSSGPFTQEVAPPSGGTSEFLRLTFGKQAGATPLWTSGGFDVSNLSYVTIEDINIDGQAISPNSNIKVGISAGNCTWLKIDRVNVDRCNESLVSAQNGFRNDINFLTGKKSGFNNADGTHGFQALFIDGSTYCRYQDTDISETGHNSLQAQRTHHNIFRRVTLSPRWKDGDFGNRTYRCFTIYNNDVNNKDLNLFEYCDTFDSGSPAANESAVMGKFRGNGNIWRFTNFHLHDTTLNRSPCVAATTDDITVSKNSKIYFCVLYDTPNAIPIQFQDRPTRRMTPITGVAITNNIIYALNSSTQKQTLESTGMDWTQSRFSTNCVFEGVADDATINIDKPFAFNGKLSAAEADVTLGQSFYSNILQDPLMTDPANGDFSLQGGSPCLNASEALTRTSSAGQGTVVPVFDASFFFDGFGWADEVGDDITVDGIKVRILSIDYANNLVTIDTNINWPANAEVRLFNAPHVGSWQPTVAADQANDDSGFSIEQDTATATDIDVLANDIVDTGTASVGAISNIIPVTSSVVAATNVTTNDIVEAIPPAGYNGPVTFTYGLNKGDPNSPTSTGLTANVTINVTPVSSGGGAVETVTDNYNGAVSNATPEEIEAHTADLDVPGNTPPSIYGQAPGTVAEVLNGVMTFKALDARVGYDCDSALGTIFLKVDPNTQANYTSVCVRWTDAGGSTQGFLVVSVPNPTSLSRILIKQFHNEDPTSQSGTTLKDSGNTLSFQNSAPYWLRIEVSATEIKADYSTDGLNYLTGVSANSGDGYTDQYNTVTVHGPWCEKLGSPAASIDDFRFLDSTAAPTTPLTVQNVFFDDDDEPRVGIHIGDTNVEVPLGLIGQSGLLKYVDLSQDPDATTAWISAVQEVTNCSVSLTAKKKVLFNSGTTLTTQNRGVGLFSFTVTDDRGSSDTAIASVDFYALAQGLVSRTYAIPTQSRTLTAGVAAAIAVSGNSFLDYTVNWSNVLGPDDTIATFTFVGITPGINLANGSFTNTSVDFWLSFDPAANGDMSITSRITTTGGRTYDYTVELIVGDIAPVAYIRDPDSIVDYLFDWTAWLVNNELIESHVFTVAGLVPGTETISDKKALQWISGGAGSIVSKVTTNQGRIDERTISIGVAEA